MIAPHVHLMGSFPYVRIIDMRYLDLSLAFFVDFFLCDFVLSFLFICFPQISQMWSRHFEYALEQYPYRLVILKFLSGQWMITLLMNVSASSVTVWVSSSLWSVQCHVTVLLSSSQTSILLSAITGREVQRVMQPTTPLMLSVSLSKSLSSMSSSSMSGSLSGAWMQKPSGQLR